MACQARCFHGGRMTHSAPFLPLDPLRPVLRRHCCTCRPRLSPCVRSSAPTCRAGASSMTAASACGMRPALTKKHASLPASIVRAFSRTTICWCSAYSMTPRAPCSTSCMYACTPCTRAAPMTAASVQAHPGVDEEARFLASVYRSRLQQDNDLLVLGVFDDAEGALLDQLHVRLHSLHSRCAELHSLQHGQAHPQAALRALCPSVRRRRPAPPLRAAATGLHLPVRPGAAGPGFQLRRHPARPPPGCGRMA